MTVAEAITYLQKVALKYGGDAPVFFDCPKCDESFEPNRVDVVAVHLQCGKPGGE